MIYTVHIIIAWGGVCREELDIDSAKLINIAPLRSCNQTER